MELTKVIEDLRAELRLVVDVLHAIERLAGFRSKRKGRRPKWLAAAKAQDSRQPKVRRSKRSPS